MTNLQLLPITRPTRKHGLRPIFLALSLLALGGLGAHLYVGFLSSNSALSVANPATGGVFMLGAGTGSASVPSAITSTVYGGVGHEAGVVTTTSPSWAPAAGSAGSVVTAGDLALADVSNASSPLDVTVHIVNLVALSNDYSSFAFPIAVYYAATGAAGSAPITGSCDKTQGCNWQLATGAAGAPNVSNDLTYLTNDGGSVAFNLPSGAYYEITIQAGGSYYCTSTATSAQSSLSPSFFVNSNAA